MTLKEIGQALKFRREFLQLRQGDLSEMSGITIRTIYDIEKGSSNPSFTTLEKLTDTLGMEITIQVKTIK
ncbi:hypothetical protein A4H97_22815 [Niastella yeongjuensis]|uniref:HTH cro/C1-type domain-containing protein n=1 Tax=Niastella yeongjuensis TaxID=354355 RepID=A0A1V9F7N7_9BACT|nr:helix-turn-helix domain-containing protein [Niastella yeongjuensis]OQP54368.1 hypothetical protein A4H97_22815 [Niastella yeongjuensis]